MDEITILCTGDLHLGRHPSRIPRSIDGQQFSPKAVWRSIVRTAIEAAVDAVVITGDVVDRENRYFEAYGAFEDGVLQLAEAGIPIVVIAGNHDFDVLPRMVTDLGVDTLHLLGADERWERFTLTQDGDPVVHFDGWSFANEHVLNSPLDGYDREHPTDAPLIGILHADLDARGSQYAPVQTSELQNTPADGWLLGHIHSPGVRVDADPLVLYPGSPQALDPGEAGTHGPWLLTLTGDGELDAEQRSLATVRYDRLEIDVTDADDEKSIPPLVSERISEHVRTRVDTGALQLLLARVRLTGRTGAHAEIVDQRESLAEQLTFREGSLPVHVEAIEVDTRPVANLEELAPGDSAAAYIAQLLLELERGELSDEYTHLVEDSQDAMQRAYGAGAYNLLRREGQARSPTRADTLDTLQQQARLVLDTLLAQKEDRA